MKTIKEEKKRIVVKFETEDGQTFYDKKCALQHETLLNNLKKYKLKQIQIYLNEDCVYYFIEVFDPKDKELHKTIQTYFGCSKSDISPILGKSIIEQNFETDHINFYTIKEFKESIIHKIDCLNLSMKTVESLENENNS